MRHLTKLSLGMGFVCALGFAGCSSSDDNSENVPAGGGSSGHGGSSAANGGLDMAGGANGGTFGAAGTAGGSGGDSTLAGGAGLGGGAGTLSTSGSGGSGGAAIPALVLFDSILIRPKSADVTGAGGEGGEGPTGADGSPEQTAEAGSPSVTGAAGAGTTGAGDFSRSFTFDTTLGLWALHAEGSTPDIGSSGGGEKLSAQSLLSVNTTDGDPAPGSMQISIPFSHTGEQLDVNQLFATAASMAENWTGYEMVAKARVVSSGNMPDCLGAWVYATSAGFVFARGAEVLITPADNWVDLRFDLDAPDIAGSKADFDKTTINQFGVMVETNHCP